MAVLVTTLGWGGDRRGPREVAVVDRDHEGDLRLLRPPPPRLKETCNVSPNMASIKSGTQQPKHRSLRIAQINGEFI